MTLDSIPEKASVLKRVKLHNNETGQVLTISLSEKQGVYSFQFSVLHGETNIEGYAELLNTTKKAYEGKTVDQDTALEVWHDYLLNLNDNAIEVVEIPPYDELQLQISIDTVTGKKLAKFGVQSYAASEGLSDHARDITRRVMESLCSGVSVPDSEILAAIQRGDHQEAHSIIKATLEKGFYYLATKEEKSKLLQVMAEIQPLQLTPEQRKNFYEARFILGGEYLKSFENLFDEADKYLEEFENSISQDLKLNVLLLKANAATQQGRKELAALLYKQVISCTNSPVRAWAYRGIAKILGPYDPDSYANESLAADCFLQAGNKMEYANSQLYIARQLKSTDPQTSLAIINNIIKVFDKDNLHNQEIIASLLQEKAMLLDKIGETQESLNEAVRAAEIRTGSNIVGNELEAISSINTVFYLSEKVKDLMTPQRFKVLHSQAELVMNEEDKNYYSLTKRIATLLGEDNLIELAKLGNDVLRLGQPDLIVLYYMAMGIRDATIEKRIQHLETALVKVQQYNLRNDMWALLSSAFANVYLESGALEEALKWFRESMKHDPYNFIDRQNYLSLLWTKKLWKESAEFLGAQLERQPETPEILYAYGRSLFEAGDPQRAIPILRKVQKMGPSPSYVEEYLLKAIDACAAGNLPVLPLQMDENAIEQISLDRLTNCLNDFASFIKQDKRKTFWQSNGPTKGHKWISHPEKHGQNLLHTFVKSRFDDAVEALEEVGAGAGRIDIYIRFRSGLAVIVELKMCGDGYTKSYAQDGLQQLAHYLDNKGTHIGYLMIFDGRLRDYGKGFQSSYSHNAYTIYATVIDVRPTVKIDQPNACGS